MMLVVKFNVDSAKTEQVTDTYTVKAQGTDISAMTFSKRQQMRANN